MAEWTQPPGKITRPGQEAGGNYREEETTVSESIAELRFLSFLKENMIVLGRGWIRKC